MKIKLKGKTNVKNNSKLQKVNAELKAVDEKIIELNKKQGNLKSEKTELENLEFANACRKAKISIEELPEVMHIISACHNANISLSEIPKIIEQFKTTHNVEQSKSNLMEENFYE